MKKAIFLVFFTILGFFKPAFLGAMDKPQKSTASVTAQLASKDQVIAHLKTYILTYQVSKLAQQKLEALKVIKEHSHLVRLFLSIIVERKVPNTPFKKQLNTLLQTPECKAMLLQCRSINLFKRDDFDENLYAFSECCVKIAKSFDHPLINKISQWLKANNEIYEIYSKSIELFDENKETPSSPKIQKYFEFHNATFKFGGTIDTEQISDLRAWIDAFEEKKMQLVASFSKLIEQLPVDEAEKFQESFIPDGELRTLLTKNIGADWGGLALSYIHHGDSSICALVKKRFEENKLEGFFPPQTRAFEERKKKNQQKKQTKNKRKKSRRKKKRSQVDISSVKTEQEKVPTITFSAKKTKSPQELLVSKLQSYYPAVEIVSLFSHMVQLTDKITKRTFILYNATGKTDYLDPLQFAQLSKIPKLHWRVIRWNKDIDQAIAQAQKETGKKIIGGDRKDWIRKHQLPTAALYYFRSMGHERTFIDKDGTKINCIYFVGRLKDGKKYTRDGYFGLGFLPGTQETIYHACFEPKQFTQILTQDAELSPEQKINLSRAFKLKNKKS